MQTDTISTGTAVEGDQLGMRGLARRKIDLSTRTDWPVDIGWYREFYHVGTGLVIGHLSLRDALALVCELHPVPGLLDRAPEALPA